MYMFTPDGEKALVTPEQVDDLLQDGWSKEEPSEGKPGKKEVAAPKDAPAASGKPNLFKKP